MKNYLLIIIMCLAFVTCKSDVSKNSSTTAQETTTATQQKNGNVITQKVTVAPSSENVDINAATALEMIAKNNQIKVLDVRTPGEIKDGAYPNSLKIDFNEDSFKTEINKLDKNDTYIVYCRSGGRSKKAVSMMKAFGFSKAYNMEEGYKGFAKASK